MELKKMLIIPLCLSIGFAAALSGCTGNEPSDEKLVETSAESSAPSKEESNTASEAVSDENDASSTPAAEASKQISAAADSTKTLWDDSIGDIIEMDFRFTSEEGYNYYSTDDKEMLNKLTEALKGIKLGNETAERSDDKALVFYTAKSKSGCFTFEKGRAVVDDKCYETEGYEKLEEVLKEIKEKYPEWKKKYDEWIHKMSMVDNRVAEMCYGSEYLNADFNKKHDMAMALLTELEQNDLIKKGTIYDGGDSITYTYNCHEDGASGGIMLKDFDPMMNGTDSGENILPGDRPTDESSVPLDALIGPQADVKTNRPAAFTELKSSDAALISKKTAADAEKSFTNEKAENKNLTKKFLSGEPAADGKHFQMVIYGAENGNSDKIVSLIYDNQKQGDKIYYGLSAEYNGEKNYSAILRLGDKIYSIDGESNSADRYSESDEIDEDNIKTMFNLEEMFGVFSKFGFCTLDDKKMYYEVYADNTFMTILYYENDKLYKGEFYSLAGTLDDDTDIKKVTDNSKLILAGVLYGNYDMEINSKLFELPETNAALD